MPIDKETVRHVALLSRIDLSDDELDMFTKQLSAIVQYVDQLKQVDTTGIAPMEHTPREGGNIVRDDTIHSSLDPSKALEQSPEQAAGYFRVPRVVE